MIQRHQGTLLSLFNLRGTKLGAMLTMLISGLGLFFVAKHEDKPPATTTNPPMTAEKGSRIPCTLERVIDGDTVVANCNGAAGTRIRMAKIDAPEMGQKPVGDKSREFLQQILPQQFILAYEGTDFYKRALGELYNHNQNINLRMVQDGYAFAYDARSTPKAYREAEEIARNNKEGLWGDYPDDMKSPKEWRKYNK